MFVLNIFGAGAKMDSEKFPAYASSVFCSAKSTFPLRGRQRHHEFCATNKEILHFVVENLGDRYFLSLLSGFTGRRGHRPLRFVMNFVQTKRGFPQKRENLLD